MADWESTLARLVRDRGDALNRFAFLVCGDRDDAADLVQDSLVRTFARISNGFTVQSAESYVRKGIINAHFDSVRKAIRFRERAHLNVTAEEIPAGDGEVDDRLDLASRLSTLAPRERVAIVLRYYEDLTVPQVAATMGLSTGTVKRYLSDALSRLRVTQHETAEAEPPEGEPLATRQVKGA